MKKEFVAPAILIMMLFAILFIGYFKKDENSRIVLTPTKDFLRPYDVKVIK